jgi:hypothetical protein
VYAVGAPRELVAWYFFPVVYHRLGKITWAFADGNAKTHRMSYFSRNYAKFAKLPRIRKITYFSREESREQVPFSGIDGEQSVIQTHAMKSITRDAISVRTIEATNGRHHGSLAVRLESTPRFPDTAKNTFDQSRVYIRPIRSPDPGQRGVGLDALTLRADSRKISECHCSR